MKRNDIEQLADVAYHPKDIGASIASGSFLTEGMVIAPCSMKTLAAIAHAHADDLVSRAADVVLKERRRLVLVPREAPFNLAHLRNMVAVTEMGGIVFPPVPAFYAKPKMLEDLVDHTVARVLDLFGIHSPTLARWQGMKEVLQRAGERLGLLQVGEVRGLRQHHQFRARRVVVDLAHRRGVRRVVGADDDEDRALDLLQPRGEVDFRNRVAAADVAGHRRGDDQLARPAPRPRVATCGKAR